MTGQGTVCLCLLLPARVTCSQVELASPSLSSRFIRCDKQACEARLFLIGSRFSCICILTKCFRNSKASIEFKGSFRLSNSS